MNLTRNLMVLLVVSCLCVTDQIFAQEQKQMSMEEAMKQIMPGPQHEHLKAFVGHWVQDIKYSFIPGQPPQQAKGTAERKLILDGRFLLTEGQGGEMMSLPVKSLAILGHDNRQGVFTLYGFDTLGTFAINPTGSYDPEKQQFTFTGVEEDPKAGLKMDYKILMRWINKDQFVSEIIFIGPDGKEFKAVEVAHTRK